MSNSRPLEGVNVLTLGGIGPVPFAGMVLADLGATVTRVERPGAGAGPGSVPHDVLFRDQILWERNLKDPAHVSEILDRLPSTHILLEGFRPGVAERLGLGPEEAMRANPALVYGRMTGWGQSGPLAQRAGHDINYVAISGALEPIAGADGTPVPPMNLLGDFGGGSMYLIAGALAALIRANLTGQGSVIDAAIVDGCASMTAMLHSLRAAGQWSGGRAGNLLDGGAPFYSVYRTADDRYMTVGAIEPQFYAELVEKLGLEGELDPAKQYDESTWPAMREAFARTFAAKTQREWTQVFEGSDACAFEVVAPDEVLSHPHLAARQSYVERDGVTHPSPAPRFLA